MMTIYDFFVLDKIQLPVDSICNALSTRHKVHKTVYIQSSPSFIFFWIDDNNQPHLGHYNAVSMTTYITYDMLTSSLDAFEYDLTKMVIDNKNN